MVCARVRQKERPGGTRCGGLRILAGALDQRGGGRDIDRSMDSDGTSE
jgi:hypothetical protein